MTTSNVIKEQKTLTTEQWAEIEKFAAMGRIKNQITDLLESAPELSIDDTFEFLHGLVVRELRKRKAI